MVGGTPSSHGGYPIQSWWGVPHPVMVGGTLGILHHPDLEWGTPPSRPRIGYPPDLGQGTVQTWDGVPPWPRTGYPPRPGTGYPFRGVDWQTNWKQYLPSSFGGKPPTFSYYFLPTICSFSLFTYCLDERFSFSIIFSTICLLALIFFKQSKKNDTFCVLWIVFLLFHIISTKKSHEPLHDQYPQSSPMFSFFVTKTNERSRCNWPLDLR